MSLQVTSQRNSRRPKRHGNPPAFKKSEAEYSLDMSSQDSSHRSYIKGFKNEHLSTCESERVIQDVKASKNKLKVELCRNFIEKGYCPYEARCKFAHGVEELRAKDTLTNSDFYRTRKCKIFYENFQCKFGERCNFIHEHRKIQDIQLSASHKVKSALRNGFLELLISQRAQTTLQSRLLSMLEVPAQIENAN